MKMLNIILIFSEILGFWAAPVGFPPGRYVSPFAYFGSLAAWPPTPGLHIAAASFNIEVKSKIN